MFEVVIAESKEVIMTSSRKEDAEACLRSLLEVDKVDAFIRQTKVLLNE
jgi:hypothetical protein